jgi:hypothetical protein
VPFSRPAGNAVRALPNELAWLTRELRDALVAVTRSIAESRYRGRVLARDARSLFCAALFCWVALALFAPPRALAQSDAGAPAPRVLFLMPELSAGLRTQLQDALHAQLSLVDAELVLRDDAEGREPSALAQAERARIVLWLDTSADGRWLLHIMDVGQQRSVARRIDAREPQRGAAIEAIAVLTREASRGGPLPEEPPVEAENAAPEPPEQAEPGVEAAPEEPSTDPPPPAPDQPETDAAPPSLRLALFYSGVDFARETSFNHGAGLSARLGWEGGFFASLHAGWASLAKPPGELVVQRIPLGAAVGYRIQLLSQVWADLELGVLLDLMQRSTRGSGTGQTDSLRAAAGVAPRLRGEYRPLEFLGLFAGFGLDWSLTTLRYDSRSTPRRTLLSPNWVRPAIEAGVAFYP